MKDILPLKRLYIKTELKEKSLINLSVSNTHYISNVLRIREKQKISIFNGIQGEWEGIIENLSKKKVIVYHMHVCWYLKRFCEDFKNLKTFVTISM